MVEHGDNHFIEISVDGASQPQALVAACTTAGDQHPLAEISGSPGHLLLLKLWQREEDLVARRTGAQETRLDGLRHETFRLCCLFFAFHGLSLTLLFVASVGRADHNRACKDWWVPCGLSLLTSLVIIFSVHTKVCAYWGDWRRLQRERDAGRALARCAQELRMKGAGFELSREPQAARRVRSSSVEVQWRLLRWCSRNLVTICLVCFTGLLFPGCKFVLCG